MTKEFGNTLHQMKGVLIFGALLGAVVGGLGFWAALQRHDDPWKVIPIALLLSAIVPLFVLPTCFFSLRIDEERITHYFCRKWRLSEGRLDELTVVEIGFSAGAVFRFTNRKSIHFMGAHLRILEAMCKHIRELRPEFEGFRFGPRAAMLLSVMRAMSPNHHEPTHGGS